jgi:hypothetical protein
MPSLSRKENYLCALRHEETEYTPCSWAQDMDMCGVSHSIEGGLPETNYVDGFGVEWAISEFAIGGVIPTPGKFILKDITRWKQTVTIPKVDDLDWQKYAEEEEVLMGIDRDKRALVYVAGLGIWDRLAALMGFEEAMIALIEEPEACNELFAAITDVKIKLAEKAARYYKADAFMDCNDIATERGLFMSPQTYRTLIKPHHKRLYDAVKNFGMLPIQHTCGIAEACVEDFIEIGVAAWDSIQPTNDIKGLLDKYGDRICLQGGGDTNGKCSRPDSTVEEVVAEVERCFREYGGKRGFIFAGFLMNSSNYEKYEEKNAAIIETADRIRFAGK